MTRTPHRAFAYCNKPDTRVGWSQHYGRAPSAGKGARTDLEDACEMLSKRGIRALAQERPHMAVRYYHGFRALVALLDAGRRHMPLSVHLHIGPPGCKSDRMIPTGAGKIYCTESGAAWFDDCIDRDVGYLEGMRQNTNIPDSTLHQIVRAYSWMMPIKGSVYPRSYRSLHILSECNVREWYPHIPQSYVYSLEQHITSTATYDVQE